MKHALLLAALLGGSAHAADRTLTITDFDRVRVEGSYVVDIATGRGPSGRISGSTAAIDRVSVEVQDRTLVVRADPGGWGGYPGADVGPVHIRVTTPSLRAAWVGGSGTVAILGMKGSDLDLTLQGAGSLTVSGIVADRVTFGMTGAGSAVLAGKTAQASFAVRGSGNLIATALFVKDATITTEGSGDVKTMVARAVTVAATGTGNATVAGHPACTVSNTGSGTVTCGR